MTRSDRVKGENLNVDNNRATSVEMTFKDSTLFHADVGCLFEKTVIQSLQNHQRSGCS